MPIFNPPRAVRQDDFDALCSASLQLGDSVYVSSEMVGDTYVVDRADPYFIERMPAIGIVVLKYSDERCKVRIRGFVSSSYGPLDLNRRYFIGDVGRPTATPPSPDPSGSVFIQVLGVATDVDQLLIEPNWQIIKRIT